MFRMAEAPLQYISSPHGISARMSGIVSAFLPPSAGGDEDAAKAAARGPAKIDLATAENWLIREELLPICKDAIKQNLTVEVKFLHPPPELQTNIYLTRRRKKC